MTKYEKALQEYNSYQHGTNKNNKHYSKVSKRHIVPGCHCEGAWWRMSFGHLATDVHIANKYKVNVRLLQMLIFLMKEGESHIPELCALLDSYTNLTGQPLTITTMKATLKRLQGEEHSDVLDEPAEADSQ